MPPNRAATRNIPHDVMLDIFDKLPGRNQARMAGASRAFAERAKTSHAVAQARGKHVADRLVNPVANRLAEALGAYMREWKRNGGYEGRKDTSKTSLGFRLNNDEAKGILTFQGHGGGYFLVDVAIEVRGHEYVLNLPARDSTLKMIRHLEDGDEDLEPGERIKTARFNVMFSAIKKAVEEYNRQPVHAYEPIPQ